MYAHKCCMKFQEVLTHSPPPCPHPLTGNRCEYDTQDTNTKEDQDSEGK